MSLSPCSSDLGADIISALGALTCADGATLFIQGRATGGTWQLIKVQVASDGSITEEWRADTEVGTGTGSQDYYDKISVGENYLLVCGRLDTTYHLINKSTGATVVSRDLTGLEVGTSKQYAPVSSISDNTDMTIIGDFAYFSSWWYIDKTATGVTDYVLPGLHVLNLSDLTDYSSSIAFQYGTPDFLNSIRRDRVVSLGDLGRHSTAYTLTGGHRITVIQSSSKFGTSFIENRLRHKAVHFSIDDITDPAPAYSGVTQVIDPDANNWDPEKINAPVVVGGVRLFPSPDNRFSYSLNAVGSVNRLPVGAFRTIAASNDTVNSTFFATDDANIGTSNDYISNLSTKSSRAAVDLATQISCVDANDRAYSIALSGRRYNSTSDINDSTALDFSTLDNIDEIANEFNHAACDRAGGGIHGSDSGVW